MVTLKGLKSDPSRFAGKLPPSRLLVPDGAVRTDPPPGAVAHELLLRVRLAKAVHEMPGSSQP